MPTPILYLAPFSLILFCTAIPAQEPEEPPQMSQGSVQLPDQPNSPVLTVSATTVKLIQEALNGAGYNAGLVDGQWSSQTEEALRRFQDERGLEARGNINFQTLSALGILLGKHGEFGAATAPARHDVTPKDNP